MFYYKAPNPYQESKFSFLKSFKKIFSLSASSPSVGELILPAQNRGKLTLSERTIETLENTFKVSVERGQVHTYDEAQLETIEIKPKKATKRYIIKFNGNGFFFADRLQEFAQDAARLDATVIGFDYRGVNYSTLSPKVYQALLTDGIAQVMRLLDKGVLPEQILLDGHSLGGSIATMVAKYFYDKGQTVCLWNDRSFSSLAKAAAGIVCSGGLWEAIGAKSTHSVLASTEWNVDVAKAYNALPKDKKAYVYAESDQVISENASLHNAVEPYEKKLGFFTGFRVKHNWDINPHSANRNELENKADPSQTEQQLFEAFVMTRM